MAVTFIMNAWWAYNIRPQKTESAQRPASLRGAQTAHGQHIANITCTQQSCMSDELKQTHTGDRLLRVLLLWPVRPFPDGSAHEVKH